MSLVSLVKVEVLVGMILFDYGLSVSCYTKQLVFACLISNYFATKIIVDYIVKIKLIAFDIFCGTYYSNKTVAIKINHIL